MGWFSSESPKPAGPKPSSDGAFEAPDRSRRAQCWEARDAYFRCLDQHNIIDSVTNKDTAAAQCGKEGQVFEQNCASSWVQYFKKRRIVDYKKEQTLKQLEAEGAQPLPQSRA
ncbi:uncharacterized protein K452DRAFT_223063 [Aplosporella prunicola CBS 121167]|uniref:Cytochrome c oxidase assembly factor 6 n=1 Tax=Aplosporella prunicola CBS 121167 TaxID=1176127 RepID=A0A6A6BMQ7_9PEZI|nr:uncharacterized protein K452DRAFT_223063 [Aplosporella prunicola CBS 121167]KAF2144693.1 hypothetical protein K452DRAFT_223063 [Aplosporella prunicola CBS 121167]